MPFPHAYKFWDAPISHRFFNGGMPDELPFSIAMIKNSLYPHQDNYKPFYWEAATKPPLRLEGAELKDFYAYSMGGHMAHPIMKKTYDNYVKFYGRQFGAQFPYLWIDKRTYMDGRKSW